RHPPPTLFPYPPLFRSAVQLSRRSVIANQQNIFARSGRQPHRLAPDSPAVVSLASTPMFHIGGCSALLTHFLTGGRIVLTQGRLDRKSTRLNSSHLGIS